MHTNTTWNDRGLLLLRLALGSVFFMHGWQKLTLMGPGGVAGFLGSSGVPLPGLAALLLIGVELVGGLVVMAGLLTRLTAAMQAFAMLVATALVHLPNGYFMPNGVEFSLTLMLASLALTLTGPGRYSVDAKLFGAEPLLTLAPSRLRRAA